MPFQIVRNDITKMHVDAIVNTANPMPGYGPGIDTAVYEAAGADKLLARRKEIGMIDRGCSVITEGYDLPAKYIIHTVGTGWRGGGQGEEAVIRKCYRSVFDLAVENAVDSLAIPLLASGSYGFPKDLALRIALSEIEAFMTDHDLKLFLVVFDEKSFSLSSELFGDIDSYINDNYVEEKKKEEYPEDFESGNGRAFVSLSANMAGSSFHGFGKQRSKAVSERKTEKRAGERLKRSSEEAMYGTSVCAAQMEKRSLEDVVKSLDKTFMEMVFTFADEKGMTDVEVQKRANLDRKAFSKLKCGTTKNPSKATALAFAIALKLSLDDTKDLLSRAGFALSPCSKQDVIVRYFIEHEAYDIYEVNVALFEHGEQTLGVSA